VADFLLRWQAWAEALACLDSLRTLAPAQLEQRAAALQGLGRTKEALRLLEQRVRTHSSLPAAGLLARMRLAAGEVARALEEARRLPGAPGALVLGELLLASGATDEAEAVFLNLHKDAPGSRQAIAGLMRVEHRRGDFVAASAYAMRALDLAQRGPELAVDELLAVRDVLQASGDAARVRELNQQLVARFDRDLAEIKSLVASTRPALPPQPPQPASASKRVALPHEGVRATPVDPAHPAGADRLNTPSSTSDWTPASPAAALSSVAVSSKERSDLAREARRLFGYAKLLPGQAEVLACVGRREHVLAVMPTGAGKSLCYQLPAFHGEGSTRDAPRGVTLVVSPLVALMKDQIDGLPADLRRKAVAVNSSLDGDDLRRIVERIATRQYRLVYVAPERLRQLPFLQALRRAGVERLVVDEAHCVSIWGHDFRPDYLHLAQAHADLGGPPILAMTATAPPRVRHDIERQLLGAAGKGQAAMRVLVGETFRPNLQLTAVRVRDEEEEQDALIALLRRLPAPGIVYVRSRKRCDELAQVLAAYGVPASAYHAGLQDRAAIQDRFMRNELAVIVATVAFGMGVDKPDIRFIVHCGLPSSVEGYYQEIGRAGRDGEMSHCLLLYTEGERTALARLAARDRVGEESVRTVYAAVRAALGGAATGTVSLAHVAGALRSSETQARMLLGALEQTGLIRRHYDAPQTLTVQRLPQRSGRRPTGPVDHNLAAFLRRANLEAHTTASGDFVALAAATGIPAEELEARLLAWQEEGWLRYFPSGRAPLLSLPPAPADAAQRIESLISRRAAVAQQRVQEIDYYAHTRACRHAFLAEHLGGQGDVAARSRCGVCDNCGAGLHLPLAASASPSAADYVLATLAEQSWGRRTLIRLLRGDPEAPERAQAASSYGCLRERGEQSLGRLIDSLLGEGLIAERRLEHGGVTLEATRQGLASLNASSKAAASSGAGQRGSAAAQKTRSPRKPSSAFARWHKKG
jgi:RecQ family ATP-dependent DNA helicase